jgi:hypothetical protein
LIFKPMVAVYEVTCVINYAGFALSAGTAPAQIGRIHARAFHRFEQAFILAHLDHFVGHGQFDFKRFARLRRKEFLVMHSLIRPAEFFRRRAHPIDHALGAANIDMCADGLTVEQGLKRNRLILIVVVDVRLIGMLGGQLIYIRSKRLVAAGIVQFPSAAQTFTLLDLGQKGRDADAARKEQMFLGTQIQ